MVASNATLSLSLSLSLSIYIYKDYAQCALCVSAIWEIIKPLLFFFPHGFVLKYESSIDLSIIALFLTPFDQFHFIEGR